MLVSELTKPTKKRRKKKTSASSGAAASVGGVKQSAAPARPPGDYYSVEVSKITPKTVKLCQGENAETGAFVPASKDEGKDGIESGSQLFEVDGLRVESMGFKEAAVKLWNSKKGTLVFKKNPDLHTKWQKAEVTKAEGNTLFSQKKIDDSISRYGEASKLHPTNWVYYSNKVLALLQKAKRATNEEEKLASYHEALADCRTMQELDVFNNHPKGHHVRGVTLLEMGRYQNAKVAFQTVLTIDRENQKAKDRIAECDKLIAKEKAEAEEKAKVAKAAEKAAEAPTGLNTKSPEKTNGKHSNSSEEIDPTVAKIVAEAIEKGVNKTVMEATQAVGNGEK